MAESSGDPTTDTAPVEGGETSSNKTTILSTEESPVDCSASEMGPPGPTESSLEESKKDNFPSKTTDAAAEKKEPISETERANDTAASEPNQNPPEASLSDDKEQNGNNYDSDPEKKETDSCEDKGDTTTSKEENQSLAAGPVVSSTKRTRPPYKYDPEKVTLRFLFANRDGLTVTVECKPGDTVGEVKGQLLSVWPKDLPDCSSSDQLRLICMGKGMLMPDSRTLEDCQVPVFKTHPTPINVSVRPNTTAVETTKSSKGDGIRASSTPGNTTSRTSDESGQGCGCVIQ
ncbi:ubiquitin-2/rad60 SUMO-like protein [Nitzschia inconspicua]|uniref:Ubiquitin-2/rad60 SUMO-like protein n=1 Tax=Nitzschia inconspicua TaxID=303405 RepID=A0A9K3LQY5_9STRA|nr:ubiquitin-2/rad60 SUMO-like protein [Nitzschia inconspicua]